MRDLPPAATESCHGLLAFEGLARGRRWARLPVLLLVLPGLVGCPQQQQPTEGADLVLTNGKLVTLSAAQPEASAIAIVDGKIVFVGSSRGAKAYIDSNTEVIDLDGALAIPGFIEGHGHFYSLGQSKLELELASAGSWREIVDRVAAAVTAAEPGEWIVGRGWHQSKWESLPEPSYQGLPTHHALSAVSPENPVLLTHASGHAAFANAKAMALAGVDQHTGDPEGGEIVHDASGAPTGALRETAQQLVSAARAMEWDEDYARKVVQIAGEVSLANGITSFQDAGSSLQLIDFYAGLAAAGELPVRLWVMIREDNETLWEHLLDYFMIDVGDGFLTVRAIKRAIDGALGSHGAWLFAPYTDLPDSSGLNTTDLELLEETADIALEYGFQLCVHAIGDRGNSEVLDLFEKTFEATGGTGHELRWRIEHAQHLDPADVPRFAELGVIASVQGIHCTSDGPWIADRLGEQRSREGAYLWRSLLDSGAILSNGTDTPVEDVSPIASFYASVSRRLADGTAFYPEQRMTRQEALRSYTLSAAVAAFEEESKGSLEVGKLGDIAVLSRDITTVPEEEIPGTEVLYTIVGGKVRYRSSSLQDG